MIELTIFLSGVIVAYCLGNVTGFAQGRNFVEAQLIPSRPDPPAYAHMSEGRRDLIDHISRNSLAWDETNHTYRKVYDAEIIEFPGGR